MKKVLFAFYSVMTIFCLAYGFPMAIVNISRNLRLSIIHFIIGGIGVLLLLIYAIYLLIKKRQAAKKAHQNKLYEEYDAYEE